jgi:hypothetical protein
LTSVLERVDLGYDPHDLRAAIEAEAAQRAWIPGERA